MADNEENTYLQQKTVDKDARLRMLKEKQNELRQKKLEEIKNQTLAAQRFKEQKEQERRQRLEEMRIKEEVRRQQVEERKRAISDAEKDRFESILRRNQQREERMEAKKKNERSNIVFAFGSSTPRNLNPQDVSASFWSPRRSTSSQNIMSCSASFVTRRQTSRDSDNGSKKRATSAGGDTRSIEASSRPGSAMSQQSTTSLTSSVSVRYRPSSASRKTRPVSIAVTGVSADFKKADAKPPIPFNKKTKTKSTEKITRNKATSGEPTPTSQMSPTTPVQEGPSVKACNNNVEKDKTDNKESSDASDSPKTITNGYRNAEKSIPAQPNKNNDEAVSSSEKQNSSVTKELVNKDKAKNNEEVSDNVADLMKTSLTAESIENSTQVSKVKISTEEEAKAALAERRRMAREEAERKAEEERLRLEMEAKAELERQQKEEEQVRLLIEAQRKAEEQRLHEAIMEAKKREEEEQKRKQEEQRLRQLKEEAERKARLEAEKQKVEQQKRLENEEKEREARRKRVEAIMLRTRGKNNLNAQQNNSEDNSNEYKSENKINGTENVGENGSKVAKEENNDNIITEEMKKSTSDALNTINHSSDSINSNNGWQAATQQYD